MGWLHIKVRNLKMAELWRKEVLVRIVTISFLNK